MHLVHKLADYPTGTGVFESGCLAGFGYKSDGTR